MAASAIFNGASVSTPVQITTSPVTANKTVTIAASKNNQMASTTITVTPPALSAIAFTPAQITGGEIGANSTTVSITLTAPAPTAGLKVSLIADSTIISGLPSSITVPANLGVTPYTYNYPVSVFANTAVAKDTAVHVTAVVNGVSKQATLTVMAPSITSLTPTDVTLQGGIYQYTDKLGNILLMSAYPTDGNPALYGGGTVSMKVGLSNNAPSGLVLNLKSSNIISTLPNAATVTTPANALVGQNITPFPLMTLPVAQDTQVSVSVWTNSTINASPTSVLIWVLAPTFAPLESPAVANYLTTTGFGLTCQDAAGNSTVGLGTNVVGAINLNSPAPAGGLKVQLTPSDPTIISVPAFVTVPANQTHATFVIKTITVTPVNTPATITATINSGNPIPQTAQQSLAITDPTVSAISFNQASIPGGDQNGVLNSTTGTVTLSANAVDEGTGGEVVNLAIFDNTGNYSQSVYFSSATPTTSVLVPTGTKTATFEIDATLGVSQNSVFTVTANTAAQTPPVSKTLTVTPATPESLDIAAGDGSATIEGGENATGTVNMNVPSLW